MEGGSNRVGRRLVIEHWHFTAHRMVVRTDGHVSCRECSQTWHLQSDHVALAALAERVEGELVMTYEEAAE